MSASSDIPKDNFELTSTLNLSSLRTVPDAKSSSQILDLLSSNEREIIEQIPGNCAMLISLAGPGKGSRFLLDRDSVKIGRDPLSDIFLDDITVSRKHCEITRNSNNQFEVCDLKSLNGTYVNTVTTAQSSLSQGDEIQIGKFRLTFFQPASATNNAGKQ
jgi:hypothetical protein